MMRPKIAVLAAAVILCPITWLTSAPAHADGACTGIANNPATMGGFMDCTRAHGEFCRWIGVGALGGLAGGTTHATCFYPNNGGRDECDLTGVGWTNQWQSHCDYLPPDAP